MRIDPQGSDPAPEQAAVIGLLRDVLRGSADPEPADLVYPGWFATGFAVQAARRQGGSVDTARAADGARASAERARANPCPAWSVDLAPREPHLEESLGRAKAQIPKVPERAAQLELLGIGTWADDERDVFCRSACLLASVWPEMLDELRAVVRQVVLLDGYGIDGFTDFTTHGAVFLNRARLDDAELPGEVRLAEALVHEGTHNRCNAAGVAHPFLAADGQGPDSLVMTPLRADPRPLTGLFQQMVVLVRSMMFYDRLLQRDDQTRYLERRDKLLAQGLQAVKTTKRHADRLTTSGRDALVEAETTLGRTATIG